MGNPVPAMDVYYVDRIAFTIIIHLDHFEGIRYLGTRCGILASGARPTYLVFTAAGFKKLRIEAIVVKIFIEIYF